MKKDCDKKAVRKDWIERVVVRLTMQRVMDEEKINRLIDAILVMQEQEDITTPALRSQLAEYVFDDKLVLTYSYQHGMQTISLEEIESALSSDFNGATPQKKRSMA